MLSNNNSRHIPRARARCEQKPGEIIPQVNAAHPACEVRGARGGGQIVFVRRRLISLFRAHTRPQNSAIRQGPEMLGPMMSQNRPSVAHTFPQNPRTSAAVFIPCNDVRWGKKDSNPRPHWYAHRAAMGPKLITGRRYSTRPNDAGEANSAHALYLISLPCVLRSRLSR